jgi:amino acid permease
VEIVGVKQRSIVRTLVAVASLTAAYLVVFAVPAYAKDVNEVITGVQQWVAGILAALATLFFSIGCIRYLLAAGNRREMERGKEAMKTAIFGYALAALAPIIIGVLRNIVGT